MVLMQVTAIDLQIFPSNWYPSLNINRALRNGADQEIKVQYANGTISSCFHSGNNSLVSCKSISIIHISPSTSNENDHTVYAKTLEYVPSNKGIISVVSAYRHYQNRISKATHHRRIIITNNHPSQNHLSVGLIVLSSLAVAAEKLPGLLILLKAGSSSTSSLPNSGSENIGRPIDVECPSLNSALSVVADWPPG
jgi:hypothetical protein